MTVGAGQHGYFLPFLGKGVQVLAGRLHEAAGEGVGIATAIAEPELERASGEEAEKQTVFEKVMATKQ